MRTISSFRRSASLFMAVMCLAGAAASRAPINKSKGPSQVPSGSTVNPDSLLLPDSSKPTFSIPETALRKPVTVIAYGDMRFTNPAEKTATDPQVRMDLVRRIAKEHPDVLLLAGDVPWHGGNRNDYAVFKEETRAWRAEHLRIFPALGNHEFDECAPAQCLENWWATFPKLKGRRWYSVQVGTNLDVIALDSDDSLKARSRQIEWLASQLDSLPHGIRFVMVVMHHPPVADPTLGERAGRNPRPNEMALRKYLRVASPRVNAKFVVIAAHVHNYERFYQDGVTYLVAGGGGAMPYPVVRTPGDLFKDRTFPNYHYVEFVLEGHVLRGTMYRLSSLGRWQVKDTFQVK